MRYEYIKEGLNNILLELKEQSNVSGEFSKDILNYDDQIKNLDEYINDVDEFGIAYELIVVLLEKYSFRILGKNAIHLLEIGLIFGFKTTRDIDDEFSRE